MMLSLLWLLVAGTLAGVGPKTQVSLIPKNQTQNNTKGSFLETTYWVFTMDDPDEDDKGIIYINLDTTLTMNGVKDMSDIWWCALIMKTAGTQVSYDCGLCHHKLDKTLDRISEPDDEQMEERESRWSLTDVYFGEPPFAHKPEVVRLFETARDPQQDWKWRDEMDFDTKLVPNTEIVVFKCPVRRLMNTQDYDDVKVEIGLFYKVKGFYVIQGPEDPATGERSFVYGSGDIITIEILDAARALGPLLAGVVAGLMFL